MNVLQIFFLYYIFFCCKCFGLKFIGICFKIQIVDILAGRIVYL